MTTGVDSNSYAIGSVVVVGDGGVSMPAAPAGNQRLNKDAKVALDRRSCAARYRPPPTGG
jgi:hypothetical protein